MIGHVFTAKVAGQAYKLLGYISHEGPRRIPQSFSIAKYYNVTNFHYLEEDTHIMN